MTRTPERTVRLTLRARALPFLAGGLLLLQLLLPYKGWTILLVGLGGAWLLSFLWSRSLTRCLELTREMRYGWAQVGDRLQERFTLSNTGRAPAPWVALVDESDLPGYDASRVLGLGERAIKHWFQEGVCVRRGLYTLGPTRLQTADPFGFYEVEIGYPTSVTMMVMPPILHLPALDVAPAGRAGEGRHPVRSLNPTVSAAGLREYKPGDSLRWIHWPTLARRDEPLVRTFDGTPSSDWWICVDMNARVQVGKGDGATDEHGVILAASLADRGLQMGRAVGLVAHGEDLIWLPPRLSADHRLEILRALALVGPGSCSMASLLASIQPALGRRSGLVIITPDLEGGWLAPLTNLVRLGAVPTVLLLDRAAFGGDGDADPTLAALEALEATHYRITPDLLDRPEARPGRVGQWRQTAQGRWEPTFDPRALAWRELT